MKKIIFLFFISTLFFLHFNTVKNLKQSISVIKYINTCMEGQASTELNFRDMEEWSNSITNKIKNTYSYRPPKVIFEGTITWGILGFIIIKRFEIDREVFDY